MRLHTPFAAADKSPATGTAARSRTNDSSHSHAIGQAAQSGGRPDDGPPEGDWMAEHVMKPTNPGPVGLPPSGAAAAQEGQAIESRRGQQ